jgi:FAD/FMN-containing dehydrogenase
VLGLEVALADGATRHDANRVTKNTTGIDLKHLFIGAEGTLGVITRLVLKLAPMPVAANTALCALGRSMLRPASSRRCASAARAVRVRGHVGRLCQCGDEDRQAAVTVCRPLSGLRACRNLGSSPEEDRQALERVL